MTTDSHSDAPGMGEGLRVGEYELLSRIGEGGMGIVHLARKPGEARVALKMLRPHIVGDDEARQRLAREVSSLQRIRSRWVAEILDADPWAEVPFVATRYVPGLSLHDHIPEEGPIAGQDLLWFAGCLAEGLAAVHDVGVLHRDVKPSNVLMEGRTPILIDFGLARVADDPKLTQTGWLLGTPGYLAPEILYGDEPTAAADIHSWGATVAFAATGDPPFGRGPAMAVMDRVRRGEHRLDGLEGPLRQVVEAALAPDPSRRPPLEEILAWLRPQTTRTDLAPPTGEAAPAFEDVFTMPLALAARSVKPEDHGPFDGDSVNEDPPTRRIATEVLPPDPAVTEWDPYAVLEPAPEPVGVMERSRRALLLLVTGAVAVVWCVAATWVAAGVLVLSVWLLRAGSLAASGVGDRRRLRGAKWHDGPRFLVGAPWDLVRSLPSTLMLLLWSGGLAVAAGLICYAASADAEVLVSASAGVFVLALWWGPGGSRVRSPLHRLVDPVSRSWRLCGVAMVALIGLGVLGYATVDSQGVSLRPGGGTPFVSTR